MIEPLAIRSTKTEEFVGDEFHPMELRIGELRLLQAKLNSGPTAILDRLQHGQWMVDDVIEPIRYGLIGGGMDHRTAHDLVTRYVTNGYLLQYLPTAIRIIMVALIGDTEDQPEAGEPVAPATEMTTLESSFDGPPTSSSLEPLATHPPT